MKIAAHIVFYFALLSLTITTAIAETWLDGGAREIEELRLQQLRTVQFNSNIDVFTTDGCSGFQSQSWAILANTFPDFEQQFGNKPPWQSCCVEHDKVYWRGDVEKGYTKRLHADQTLKQCIVETGDNLAPQLSLKYALSEAQIRQAFSTTAELMHRAVRLGGLPCTLLPWRWGYGWDNCAFK